MEYPTASANACSFSQTEETKPQVWTAGLALPPLRVDRERMDAALASTMHEIPSGLSRDEKRKLIKQIAAGAR